MKSIILPIFLISVLSCAQETPQVKKASKNKPAGTALRVVNAEDPVCHMNTDQYLKDTAVYKGKNYGFCSSLCKKEFKKNPAKYAAK